MSDSDTNTNANTNAKQKKTRQKKKLGKAPRELVDMSNPDKTRHEVYKPGQNCIRFPKPFRCVILGKVNSGKSYLAKHILMAHQGCAPKFEEVHIVHGCADTHTTEYDLIEPTSISQEIPSYLDFDPMPHKLLILDDVDFTGMNQKDLKRISELMRFGSSHCNLSVILMHQAFFRIPKIVKDCSNVFIIFRPHDNDELASIGRRVGLKKKKIFDLFNDCLPEWRDSLLINLIPNAPHKFYKNLFTPIIEEVDSD